MITVLGSAIDIIGGGVCNHLGHESLHLNEWIRYACEVQKIMRKVAMASNLDSLTILKLACSISQENRANRGNVKL